METWLIVLLIVGGLLLLAGIFRVSTKPFVSVLDVILELLWLDIIFGALGAIFEGIFDGLS